MPVRELDDLFTALAALQQRVRVSDDLAERHRRNADAASAGMFELLSGLVAAEEGARGQLSAELHDTVAQSLGVARRLLGERAGPRPATLRAGRSARRADQVEEAEESLRATMARTRPPALRDGDLAAAVLLLRDDLEHRYGLVVELSWPEVDYPIPLATAIAVYRFFQEALLNVVKHAEVDAAEVGARGRRPPRAGDRARPRRRARRRCRPSPVAAAATWGSACSASGPGWPAADWTWSARPGSARP